VLKAIIDWIDVRIGLRELIREQLTEYRVPKRINIFYTLGFVAAAAFVLQVLTGLVLLTTYVPHPDNAFGSVQKIMMTVPYGWLFRMMHIVGSNLMVVAVMLHMLSVLFMKSYAKPREVTWLAGAFMLFLTLTFCLSGYLLPWSQLSYWATTIVTTIPTAFPLVGDFMADFMRGGPQVSGATLGRFFALHVGVLPVLLALLLGIHLFLIRRIGISSPPFGKGPREPEWAAYHHEDHSDGVPFARYMVKEFSMVMVYLTVMFCVIALLPTLFLPETANIPADPFKTPAHIKPEWYFLAPYQMLKLVPSKFLGIMLQLAAVFLFLAWPFLDRKEERNILKRPLMLAAFIGILIVWTVLTLWGKYS
jgi:ubiquinol-cytochrome c reductase cytochrome b subunit